MDGSSPTIPSTTTEQLLLNILGYMEPMEASPKRGRGTIERNRDRKKLHSNNILDKSPTMIEYTQIHVH